ncbi:uncharacterized protein LOC132717005 [Ruditapes philippinarum]|uniref:uncharacterized protein LOC132717005 n=1 Tax=Ruditapes philippinarum TaxID=129788 RepID=UPI00295B0D00|nr:uncharacterized protein LOC132717005 [Ruditapes philippinarum]
MYRIWELLVVASIFQAGRCTVVNNFDGHLQFECPHENQFISHITSVHDNHREDRVFDMSCADFPIDVDGLLTSCTWTEYVNDWDGLLAFECNDNMYINGLQSDHDNHSEDRRWKVKCCEMHEIHLADWTAFTSLRHVKSIATREPLLSAEKETEKNIKDRLHVEQNNSSEMHLIWELVIVASIIHTGSCTIVNSLDRPLQYECRYENQFIAQITSVHHNRQEDRVFDMSCRDFPCDVSDLTPTCTWTEYINDWDEPIVYQCSGNRYIGGFQSYHSNRQEDRRWKVKCCGMPGVQLSNCHYTSWTNNYDGQQYFNAGTSRVTKGLVSIHSNRREDRIYKYMTCQASRN